MLNVIQVARFTPSLSDRLMKSRNVISPCLLHLLADVLIHGHSAFPCASAESEREMFTYTSMEGGQSDFCLLNSTLCLSFVHFIFFNLMQRMQNLYSGVSNENTTFIMICEAKCMTYS